VSIHPLSAEENFSVGEALLSAITPDLDLVILCSPNNPTGQQVPRPLLEQVLARCTQMGSLLMVDECFLELSDDGRGLADLLQHPNLFLLRAFTKSYAIPGLRLGYGLCSNETLIQTMEEVGACWNVSGPAQAAGIACCSCADWPKRGREIIEEERPGLVQALTALGCRVIPSQANYLLFQLPGRTDLQEQLLQRGILIRACGNYRGLGEDWYRVAIRTQAENQTLIATLRRILQW
jgi:threonine-phosphate decarboxylase